MERAAELFDLEAAPCRSPLVDRAWRARGTPAASFISVAVAHWEIVVTRQQGAARVTVRGPETRATIVPIPKDAEFFGIEFSAGTFMPGLPPSRLVDRAVTAPPATDDSFWLAGAEWVIPDWDSADAFVDGLAAAGVLVRDPVVPDALRGQAVGFSTRSLERRVARATGLSRGAAARIRRAERAVELLSAGMPASEVASQAGYADQPHLTRALRRLVGQTPAQISRSAAG
jgi:Helix-turn-helix domain